MFDNYYILRRESNPEEPKYITLCFVLHGSGEKRKEIQEIFTTYMIEGEDYDDLEEEEMVDYLVKVAQED